MKVKVQCPCGSRFEFEVEPAHERMPVPIACPTCGADATELANAVIRQQSATAPVEPGKPRMRIATQGAAPKPAAAPEVGTPKMPTPPAQSGLRIAGHGKAPEHAAPVEASVEAESLPEPAATEVQPCNRHKNEPAVANCSMCGKPICDKCLEQFGYVCSIFCREAAAHKQIDVPVFAGQRGLVRERAQRLVRYAVVSGVAVALALVGVVAWYFWFGRDPSLVYSLDFPKAKAGAEEGIGAAAFYDLIAPGRLFSIKSKRATLMDVARQSQVWSVPLPGDVADDYAFSNPRVIATAGDLWVASAGGLLRFDRQTGAAKEVAMPGDVREVIPGEDAILVVSGRAGEHGKVTRISLSDGALQTEDLAGAVPAIAPARTTAARGRGSSPTTLAAGVTGLARQQTEEPAPPADAPAIWIDPERQQFASAGQNAVQFQAKLLERKTIAHEAMKKKPGKSVLDSANVTASQGMDLAQEMMNDSQRERTGGVEIEDVSRYQLTLHRLFAKDAPDWTGEVTGPPEILPLKTVDLVVAGTNLYVFDKANKKLWDAKLTYPARQHDTSGGGPPPCLETKDALYFADKGMLTRFDAATGSVRWRLTSVGISGIKTDEHGELYIETSTAGADSIQYSQQVDFRNRVELVIARVDPEKGTVMWSTPFASQSYRVFASGRFLYSTRQWDTQDALRFEEGPDSNCNIKLLNPATGAMIWNYPMTGKRLLKTEVQQNWILLQFSDQVRVLKFFSL